jgi:hypothetical protein
VDIHRPRLIQLAAILTAALILTACAGLRPGAGSPSASATSPNASVEPSTAPPASEPASLPPSAAPSDEDLGPFACTFPVEERGEAVHSHLVDVRVGEHDGYDRVVFEFDNGIPEYVLSQAEPPYAKDPSGLPMEVEGASVLHLALIGGTRWDAEYEATYDGPLSFEPAFDKVVHLVESGDFEAVSSWYIGLSADACVRVMALDGPDRLVVDIEH